MQYKLDWMYNMKVCLGKLLDVYVRFYHHNRVDEKIRKKL